MGYSKLFLKKCDLMESKEETGGVDGISPTKIVSWWDFAKKKMCST